MVTKREVRKNIFEWHQVYMNGNKGEKSKAKKEMDRLRSVLYYFDTNPSESYLESSIKELENRRKKIKEQVKNLFRDGGMVSTTVIKREEKAAGIMEIDYKLKNLKYLLTGK